MDASSRGADVEIPPWFVWGSNLGPYIRVGDRAWQAV